MKRLTATLLLLAACGCGCGTPDIVDPLPRSIHVEGAVAKPGEYVLLKDATLTYGIASAGGYTDSVSEIRILRNSKIVFRIDGRTFQDSRNNNDPVLKNGDVIQVER
ncbi:SLBB domain-containing protein [Verrucomicrobiota bacterium]